MKNYQILAVLCILALSGCGKAQANQTKSLEELIRQHKQQKAGEESFENIKAIMEGDGQALTREVSR